MDFRIFAIVLASIATIPATDIYLPSLPGMAEYFGVTHAAVKDSIGVYQIGSFLAALVLGFLSDQKGRKPMMMVGLGLFLLGSLFCTFAKVFPLFIAGRLLEGAGAVSVPIVGWAIVHDSYSREQGIKIMALLGAIYSSLPLISPTLGGLIDVNVGWRWNFGILSILSLLTIFILAWKLEEPVFVKNVNALNFQSYLTKSFEVFKNKTFIGYVLIFSFLLCGEWCYLTLIPFYLENILSLGPQSCGFFISLIGLSYVCGSIATPKFITRLGIDTTIIVSLAISSLGAIGVVIATSLANSSFHAPTALAIAIYLFGLAIVWAPTTAKSLETFKTQKGTASSIRSLIFTAASAFGSFLAGVLNSATLFPLSVVLVTCCVGSFAILAWQYHIKISDP